jgi:carboxyl-terminal processing protease
MAWKMRGAYGLLVLSALFASFAAGYRMRAQSESGWLPPATALSSVPLVRTADGQLAVGTGSKDMRAGAAGKTHRSYPPNLKPYETLDEVRRAIKENFVKTEVKEEELTYGAIRGMLRALDDRFTRYLTPDEYAQFQEKNIGELTGIGARIDIKDDYQGSPAARPFNASRPYIVEPMEGGPAAKVGLKKDDVILEINGRSTADMSVDAVVSYIKGERGTSVKLKVERKLTTGQLNRDSTYKIFEATIVRDLIVIHPVKLEWLPNRVAWLRLNEFNKKSDAEMTSAMNELRRGPNGQGPARGLIFDMRDNPGGLLDVAVEIASRFIPTGPVVYTRERDGSERPLNAEGKRFVGLKIPIMVLVNNYSASASEIVAGALKDKGIGTLIGEPTYGKASVQVLLEMKNGGALVMTTAKYLTPAKRDISDKGIAPDVVVKANDEDEKTGRGAQLHKALAIIQEKSGGGTVAERPTG